MFSQKVVTETIEVKVPLLYCPAPPKIVKPELPILQMTDEQAAIDGEIAKHYKATIRVLIQYAKDQKMALDEYENISSSYDKLKKEIVEDNSTE